MAPVVFLAWALLVGAALAFVQFRGVDLRTNDLTKPLLAFTALATLLAILSGVVVGRAIV